MKIFRLPEKCKAILFDMDQTLYTHPVYAQSQIDLPIKRLARLRGVTFNEMNEEITRFRTHWALEHNGQQISLANIFKTFGITIEESIKWREELYQPEQYLAPDEQLRSALEQLNLRFTLAVVTNNPVSIAKRTFAVLGAEAFLNERIVGLDTCGASKPNAESFLRAAEMCGAAAQTCVSVGDRFDIDIALPLELGMGGILVDGVEDVYRLPQIME